MYRVGYFFILPAFILYGLFIIYPFFQSIYLSFTSWNGADPIKPFIGLQNYLVLSKDPVFWIAIGNNIKWIVFGVIPPITLGLFLALLLYSRPKGFMFFRTVFFMPQLLGFAVLGVIWTLIYQPHNGLLVVVGTTMKISFLSKSPLANPDTALFAVLIAQIWATTGFYFVILLAGLQNVDTSLLDAAYVDGANSFQRLFFVILPQLAPVMTMVIVNALIQSIRIFGIIWAMTQGGPGYATEVIATYAYRNFSSFGKVGYSTALTTIMAILALFVTVVFIRVREKGQEA